MQPSPVDFLTRIVAHKQRQIDARQRRTPLSTIARRAGGRKDYRGFGAALARPGPSGVNIVAEIKRASPSKGPLRLDLDPAVLAGQYERAGAVALSVLTETEFFRGSDRDLEQARQATALPVLRKDFIFTDYQIWESAAMGADAVLLIVRVLTDEQIARSLALCRQLNLDALVEVNTGDELNRATAAGAWLIGINNRNLVSFATDTATALNLAGCLGTEQIGVAASGITGPADIAAGLAAGIFNFLVGEHLVTARDPVQALRMLICAAGKQRVAQPGQSGTKAS